MMRRMFRALTAEVRGMHRAAYILAGFAFLSSLLAFLRDRLLAHTFGAGTELDIYYAAFRIPDVLFIAIASLVSAYILIPELVKRSEEKQHDYIDTVVIGFSVIMAAVGLGAYLLAPFFIPLLFPAFEAANLEQLITLTRIMLLQPVLLGFSNVLAAITQVRSRYTLYALTPLLYNLGIIGGVLFLYPLWGLSGIAWGVVIGALMHAGIQIPSILRDGFLRTLPRFSEKMAFLRTVSASLPRTLALSLNQITMLVLTVLAGGLAAGSITVFTFAFNLQQVPLAIIGSSYSVAAFPVLARMFSSGDRAAFVAQVAIAARHIIFWSLPAIALMVVLRAHIVRVILGTGAFDWTDTRLTAAAFALFLISLTAHALMLLLARVYYATGRSFVPLIVNGVTAAIAVASAGALLYVFSTERTLSFVEPLLRVEGVPGTTVLALPFAYSVAALVGIVLTIILFERHFGGLVARVKRVFGESVAAAIAGGGVAYGVLSVVGGISAATTFVSVLAHGMVAGIAGLVAAGATFALLGSTELREMFESFRRRVSRKRPVVSSGELEL